MFVLWHGVVLGVKLFVGVKDGVCVLVWVGVGLRIGLQKPHSNRLPLWINCSEFVAAAAILFVYVTQTELLSIIALKVAPVLKGTVSDTIYWIPVMQFVSILLKKLIKVDSKSSKVVLELITQYWIVDGGVIDGVGLGGE